MATKIVTMTVFLAIMLSSLSLSLNASAFELSSDEAEAESYYLLNIENDLVMVEKNINESISPSSTVKMMTACIALESGIDSNTVITVKEEMLNGLSGRNMRLKKGDRLTFDDLLYATVCGGYNDAAQVLAFSVCGNIDEFILKMNDKAKELGMISTVYMNVTGINVPGMTTTVSDIAILAKYLSKSERYIEIGKKKSYKMSSLATCQFTTVSNRSSLLASYKGLSSFNTGGVGETCAVLYYDIGDLSFISIVMNAVANDPLDQANYAETFSKSLISHARYDYSVKTVFDVNSKVATVPVKYSVSYQEIDLYLKENLNLFLPEDIDPWLDLTYSVYIEGDEIKAPVEAGQTVGELTVSMDGKILAICPLTVDKSLSKNAFLYIMDAMKTFVMSRQFIIILLCFISLMVAFYIAKSRKLNKMHKRRKIKRKK